MNINICNSKHLRNNALEYQGTIISAEDRTEITSVVISLGSLLEIINQNQKITKNNRVTFKELGIEEISYSKGGLIVFWDSLSNFFKNSELLQLSWKKTNNRWSVWNRVKDENNKTIFITEWNG